MSDVLSSVELHGCQVELLPARTVLSLLAQGSAQGSSGGSNGGPTKGGGFPDISQLTKGLGLGDLTKGLIPS